MAESRNFRSALNGFNREDVVRYIESLNAQHTTLVNQLNSEKQSLVDELNVCRAKQTADAVSALAYAALVKERDDLRAELEALRTQAPAEPQQNITDEELAAYRRAEQAERAAKERAQQMYRQAAATLADATTKVDESSALLDSISRRVTLELSELQAAVIGSRNTLQDAIANIAAINPEPNE